MGIALSWAGEVRGFDIKSSLLASSPGDGPYQMGSSSTLPAEGTCFVWSPGGMFILVVH